MTDPKQLLTSAEVDAAGPAGWTRVEQTLQASFHPADFVSGLAFVNRIGEAAEAANHHPDIVLKYSEVQVTTSSHDVGGLTSRDLDLARAVNQIAEELGLAAD